MVPLGLTRHLKSLFTQRVQLFSSASDWIKVSDVNGTALVSMNRPPVNALSTGYLRALHDTIDDLERSHVKGLVLTSENKSVFSAGLDLKELCDISPNVTHDLYSVLRETWKKLYLFPQPFAAAITGNSLAGGCLLALTSEYRVMMDSFKIGLNEVTLGIIVPSWLQMSMAKVVGEREAEIATLQGRMYSSEEARAVQLVDMLASSREQAIQMALDYVNQQSLLPGKGRAITKQQIRQPVVSFMEENRKDADDFVSLVTAEDTQRVITHYFNALRNKHNV